MALRLPTKATLCGTAAALALSACGTTVPQIGEIWEDHGNETKLELKIKQQIFCELQSAVTRVDVTDNNPIIVQAAGKTKKLAPIPEGWGVIVTLTLTVAENGDFNPGATVNETLSPVTVHPSGIPVAVPRSFNLGLGATLSSAATRVDKFTFFYLVKDLEDDTGECAPKDATHPDGRPPEDYHGSSFLLESDLGIYNWLNNAANIRTIGVSRKSKQEILSYDVKFDVVTSGNITPTWKLVPVTTTNGPLFSAKRERTHELLLTFGPTDEATVKGGKAAQPGALAVNDNLASQVGSSVSTNLKSLMGQ